MPTTQITKTDIGKNNLIPQGKTVVSKSHVDTEPMELVNSVLNPGKSVLVDPRHAYVFSAPGVATREITGEGTKVMLAHAHPGATFSRVDPAPAIPFEEPTPVEKAIDLITDAAVLAASNNEQTFETAKDEDEGKVVEDLIDQTHETLVADGPSFSEADLNAMTRDEVRAYAKQIDLPNFSKVRSNKAILIEAILAHQAMA